MRKKQNGDKKISKILNYYKKLLRNIKLLIKIDKYS